MLIKCAAMDTNGYNGINCTTGAMIRFIVAQQRVWWNFFDVSAEKKGSQGNGIKVSTIQAKYWNNKNNRIPSDMKDGKLFFYILCGHVKEWVLTSKEESFDSRDFHFYDYILLFSILGEFQG